MIPAEQFMVIVGRNRVPAASIREASLLFRVARDHFGEGGSTTPVPEIADAHGNVFAHISYNGRVWQGAKGSWTADSALLYDPLVDPEMV
ncbi:MAG: hypothetical protein HYX36_00580 [Rhizobiales bacterium]|nr:hypothetical protein [Hyphomicrobiales bacterium]